MPRGVWTAADERLYERVEQSCRKKRGAGSVKLCKRIAAGTVNKRRVVEGRAASSTCVCPRGYRVLKSDPDKCWKPGKKRHVSKTCHPKRR